MTVAPSWQAGLVDHGPAISVFSGAGGLDLGIEAAGFHVAAAVEIDGDAADTMEKNVAHFPTLANGVRRESALTVSAADLRKDAGLGRGERPALLVGGPPCTPFSKSGFWLEWKREGLDPAASLLQSYTRLLRELKPRAFILENVYALTYNNRQSRPAFERLLREVTEAGYVYQWQVLNAADYGVPQLRPRLFVVGVPKGKALPELPPPTHGGRWERRDSGNADRRHVTTGEALAGVSTTPEAEEVLRGKWSHLLSDIPPGDNYLHYTERRGHPAPVFEWRSRYWSFLLKLDPNRPSPVIQAQPGPNIGPFHWENRRLRVPEVKRLFTFPDDLELVGSRNSVQAQLGNSVPPLLAQRVAESVAAAL